MHTHICTHTCTHTHSHTLAHTLTCTHTRAHTHSRTHTHTNTHTHTQTHTNLWLHSLHDFSHIQLNEALKGDVIGLLLGLLLLGALTLGLQNPTDGKAALEARLALEWVDHGHILILPLKPAARS